METFFFFFFQIGRRRGKTLHKKEAPMRGKYCMYLFKILQDAAADIEDKWLLENANKESNGNKLCLKFTSALNSESNKDNSII